MQFENWLHLSLYNCEVVSTEVYEVYFKSNAQTAKNQSNLFIQVNFHIMSFNVVPLDFDDTFLAIGMLSDAIK